MSVSLAKQTNTLGSSLLQLLSVKPFPSKEQQQQIFELLTALGWTEIAERVRLTGHFRFPPTTN